MGPTVGQARITRGTRIRLTGLEGVAPRRGRVPDDRWPKTARRRPDGVAGESYFAGAGVGGGAAAGALTASCNDCAASSALSCFWPSVGGAAGWP